MTTPKLYINMIVKIDERTIGDQEVLVTIRWDLESDNARNQFLKKMQ